MDKIKTRELYENVYKDAFSFGKNWENFLQKLDQAKIDQAKEYLIDFMGGIDHIQDKTVIDFGSGSGLMSLAFILLGAKQVISIDIDDSSLACTQFLKHKFNVDDSKRKIKKGSILDKEFIKNLGIFDIVYSWGVIHHSGNMRDGLHHIVQLVKQGGLLYLAIYNDNSHILEGTSKLWRKIKKIYSKHKILRFPMKIIYTIYYLFGLIIHGKNPINYIKKYNTLRGMNFFTDIEDWLGGYPYEYATFDILNKYYENKGFYLINDIKARSIGCNEFLFKKK